MKTEGKKVGIISALSAMDNGQLSLFLGDHQPIFADAINNGRIERIGKLTREKISARKNIAKLRVRRMITAFAAASIAVAMLIVSTLALAMLWQGGMKGNDAMEEAPENGVKPPSQNPGDENLFYDTYADIDTLLASVDNYVTSDIDARSYIWISKNGVPIITDFVNKDDCRFGVYYNCLEVIYDDEHTGNGYMVYLLDEEHTDIMSACRSVGIDIERIYGKSEYSEGEVLINNKVCEGIVAVSKENDGFMTYYLLERKALFIVNAPDNSYVADITVEYVK